MAIIVENGSIVAGANSYVSRADFITYAANRGVSIPDTSATDVHLIKAAQYIDSHEGNLIGSRADRDQPMAFPRVGVHLDGWFWGDDEIPRNVILCQCAFALDSYLGDDLWNRPKNPSLTPKACSVAGAVSITYATGDAPQKLSKTSTGDALLASLLRNSGMRSISMVRA